MSDQQPTISLTYRTYDEASRHQDTYVKLLGQLTNPSLSIWDKAGDSGEVIDWDEEGHVTIGASLDEFVASHQSLSKALGGITSITATEGREGDFFLAASRNGGSQEFLARLHKFQEQFGGSFQTFSLAPGEEGACLNGIDVLDLFGRRNRFLEIWENIIDLNCGNRDDANLRLAFHQFVSLSEFFEQIQEFLGALSFEAQVSYLGYMATGDCCVGFKGISAVQLSANYDALHAFKGIRFLDLK